jgi:dipeptidase
MTTDKEFIWTDELVQEFSSLHYKGFVNSHDTIWDGIEKFKQSKVVKERVDTRILLFSGGTDCKNGSFAHTIITNIPIPIETRYNALKQAIEKVLNEEEKKVLFTTEDGVDIKEGEQYFNVNEKYWRVEGVHYCLKLNYETYHKSDKCFSTKEKAEEYILFHKPCLSLKEVKDHVDTFHEKSWYNTLIDKAKQKL